MQRSPNLAFLAMTWFNDEPSLIQQEGFAKTHHLVSSNDSTEAAELHQPSMQQCAGYDRRAEASAAGVDSRIEVATALFLLRRGGYQIAIVVLDINLYTNIELTFDQPQWRQRALQGLPCLYCFQNRCAQSQGYQAPPATLS